MIVNQIRLIITCFISCKKNDEDLVNKEDIIIGDLTNMKVNNYDTVLIGVYRSTQAFELDINNNWNNNEIRKYMEYVIER